MHKLFGKAPTRQGRGTLTRVKGLGRINVVTPGRQCAMSAETATIVVALIGAIATIGGALIGKSWGSRGKQAGLGSMTTELSLDGTTWIGDYKDTDASGVTKEYQGSIEFHQSGSRIVGEGISEGRKWLLEGVIYKSKVCYVYVGVDPNPVSIGTTNLEIDATGTTLDGFWTGWSPDGIKRSPQELSLQKRK